MAIVENTEKLKSGHSVCSPRFDFFYAQMVLYMTISFINLSTFQGIHSGTLNKNVNRQKFTINPENAFDYECSYYYPALNFLFRSQKM